MSTGTEPIPTPAPEARSGEETPPPVTRRRRRRVRRTMVMLGGLGVIGAAGVLIAMSTVQGRSLNRLLLTGSTPRVTTYKVTRSRLPVTVAAPGDVESAKSTEIASQVEGQSTIIFIKPEGSPVKKGDLICELDSGTLRDSLTNQVISTRKAESDYQQAVKTREVAENSVKEYINGTYPQTEQSLRDSIGIAETELLNARKKLNWSDRMLDIGYVTPSQNRADRLALEKSELSLRGARTELAVLQNYTRRKQITSLEASVDRAKSDELAKESVLRLEQAKETKLRSQIEKCRMIAPVDGMVVYAKEERPRPGSTQQIIEEGATVRERQRLVTLPDINHMRVNARVNEAQIAMISPGQKVRILIESLRGPVVEGTVQTLRPLADSRVRAETDVSLYTTLIGIDQPNPAIRPGMTAKVEILVGQHDDVLAVPVQAILQFKGKNHIYVMTAGGPVRREVKLGVTNEKFIVVTEGLREGEDVALEPVRLMSDAEQTDAFVLSNLEEIEEWDSLVARPSPGEAPPEPARAPNASGSP